jgi:hypothetical protein
LASSKGRGVSDRKLVMAYADPPYVGQSKRHYEDHPDYAGEVDHGELIDRLLGEYPDGWALSLSSPSTQLIVGLLGERGLDQLRGDFRLMSWVKPFAAFKRNVRVAYTWEPVIVKPAERLEGAIPTRDYCAVPITMQRGLVGAKPEVFCHWLFAVMGLRRSDELHDLFPGSGAVGRAWESWTMQLEVAA